VFGAGRQSPSFAYSGNVASLFLAIRWLLALTGLLLSLWVAVPPFSRQLLALAVVVPETSIWLLLFQGTLLASYFRWPSRILRSVSIAGMLLCAWPILGAAALNYDPEFRAAFGPPRDDPGFRSGRYSFWDSLVGIPQPTGVRERSNIVFSEPNLRLHLYLPAKAGRYPAIVYIYGGAWHSGTPDDDAVQNRYLAAQGYAVCAIDYRHAPAATYPAQAEDVKKAIAYIKEHATELEADGANLALVGRSAGGHLALLTAYKSADPAIKAVAAYYPPSDLIGGYDDPPSPDPIDVRAVLEQFLGGPPVKQYVRYHEAQPVEYVRKQPMPPTLLLHGTRDHVVKIQFSRVLRQLLQESKSKALLVEIPWAEHGYDAVFNGPGNQISLYYLERFLNLHLK
jgi:acetyl esterase/lipase